MTCSNCVKFDGSHCRLDPQIYYIESPEVHWCSQGQWIEWSERLRTREPYFWGEWEQQPLVH